VSIRNSEIKIGFNLQDYHMKLARKVEKSRRRKRFLYFDYVSKKFKKLMNLMELTVEKERKNIV